MPVLKTDRHSTWFLDDEGRTWTLAKSATIVDDDVAGIYERTSGSDIRVLGDIVARDSAVGVVFEGFDSSLTVETTGSVRSLGATAVYAKGNGSEIENRGLIQAKAGGIYVALKATIENFGSIRGETAIALDGSGSRVENHGKISGGIGIGAASGDTIINSPGGTISGHYAAIDLYNDGQMAIRNHGILSADHVAIRAMVGEVFLQNNGTIHGAVKLGENRDIVDSRGGTIEGAVYGGGGNDIYVVGRSHMKIVEAADGGNDEIGSLFSYTLPDNVESLRLLGHRNADGTGTAVSDRVIGNDGDNTLFGMGGADTVIGGAGEDVLIGGDGADEFYFTDQDGIDHIRDFHDGIDFLILETVHNQGDFDSLDIHQAKAGAIIDVGDGDRIILDGVNAAHLTYADFR